MPFEITETHSDFNPTSLIKQLIEANINDVEARRIIRSVLSGHDSTEGELFEKMFNELSAKGASIPKDILGLMQLRSRLRETTSSESVPD